MRGKRRVRSAEPPARTEPAACTRERSCMQRVLSGRAVLRLLTAAVLAVGLSRLLAAAAPSSATISAASPSAAWDGFGAVAAAPDGEATCVEGTYCDIFTLTLAPADYRGKRGRACSRSRALYALGGGQDVEPSVRVDYQGNAYVGAIRGLTGGNDLWRFDLTPSSATYDPFLTAATPVWRADGTLSNPAYK